MNHNRRVGLIGEILAARYLRNNGYDVVAANYYTKVGEIDIVAVYKKVICVVEVKTRIGKTMLPPREAVDYRKQNNLRSAAEFLKQDYKTKMPIRFDIIEIIVLDSTKAILKHHKNAF